MNSPSTKSTTISTADSTKMKPKRPLSAYNLFFRFKRSKVLALSNLTNLDEEETKGMICRIITALPGLEDNPSRGRDDEWRRTHIRSFLLSKLGPKNEKRSHRKSHGAMSFLEMNKMMCASWKNIDDYARGVFEELAEEGRSQYRERLAEYERSLASNQATPKKKGKRSADQIEVVVDEYSDTLKATAPDQPKDKVVPSLLQASASAATLVTPEKTAVKQHQKRPTDKKEEKGKEPERPKRPLTSYNLYFRYKRSMLIKASEMDGYCSKEANINMIRVLPGLEDQLEDQSAHRNLSASFEDKSSKDYRRSKIRSALLDNLLPKDYSKRSHSKSLGAMSFLEMNSIMCTSWKSLDTFSRGVFEELADEGKKLYAQKIAEYEQKCAGFSSSSKGKKSTSLLGKSDTEISTPRKRLKFDTERPDTSQVEICQVEQNDVKVNRNHFLTDAASHSLGNDGRGDSNGIYNKQPTFTITDKDMNSKHNTKNISKKAVPKEQSLSKSSVAATSHGSSNGIAITSNAGVPPNSKSRERSSCNNNESSNDSGNSSSKSFEDVVAEALACAKTPEDVARYLLDNDAASQFKKMAAAESPKKTLSNDDSDIKKTTKSVKESQKVASLTLIPLVHSSGKPKKSLIKEEQKQKDLERPKRPLTSYNLYFRYKRSNLIEAIENKGDFSKEESIILIKATPGLEDQPSPGIFSAAFEDKISKDYRRSKIRSALLENLLPQDKSKRSHSKSLGTMSFLEMNSIMCTSWKSLDTFSRGVFEELADEGKRLHAQKVAEYEESCAEVTSSPKRKKIRKTFVGKSDNGATQIVTPRKILKPGTQKPDASQVEISQVVLNDDEVSFADFFAEEEECYTPPTHHSRLATALPQVSPTNVATGFFDFPDVGPDILDDRLMSLPLYPDDAIEFEESIHVDNGEYARGYSSNAEMPGQLHRMSSTATMASTETTADDFIQLIARLDESL